MTYISFGSLSIAESLFNFVNDALLAELDIQSDTFWMDFEAAVNDLAPKNRRLLQKREELQSKLDKWLEEHKSTGIESEQYTEYLREIGYLMPEGENFQIETSNIDSEIATIAGPQLVVPVMNARYALNAANARWGSLYDALYGTDIIPEDGGAEKSGVYNPVRGHKVISYARNVLDTHSPLSNSSWEDAFGFAIDDGTLSISIGERSTSLSDSTQFAGYRGSPDNPSAILLVKNNLHIEIAIDPNGMIGKSDRAGINDVLLLWIVKIRLLRLMQKIKFLRIVTGLDLCEVTYLLK